MDNCYCCGIDSLLWFSVFLNLCHSKDKILFHLSVSPELDKAMTYASLQSMKFSKDLMDTQFNWSDAIIKRTA